MSKIILPDNEGKFSQREMIDNCLEMEIFIPLLSDQRDLKVDILDEKLGFSISCNNGDLYAYCCSSTSAKLEKSCRGQDCALHRKAPQIIFPAGCCRMVTFQFYYDFYALGGGLLEGYEPLGEEALFEKKGLLYKNVLYNHEGNLGDGNCLMYSVSRGSRLISWQFKK